MRRIRLKSFLRKEENRQLRYGILEVQNLTPAVRKRSTNSKPIG